MNISEHRGQAHVPDLSGVAGGASSSIDRAAELQQLELRAALQERCEAFVFDPSASGLAWEDVRQAVVEIEKLAFGNKACSESELRNEFLGAENTVVLLRDVNPQRIIGYAVAFPSDCASTDRHAWFNNLAIHPEYCGYGLLPKLMNQFEEALLAKSYASFAGNFAVGNGLADNVQKVYGEAAHVSDPDFSSPWGMQRGIVVDLSGRKAH